MPVYEYECERGHLTERIRPVISRHDKLPCPACNSPTRLIMSLPRIRTEDNNPLRQMATVMGGRDGAKWSRSETEAHMRERNTVITSARDRDGAARNASVQRREQARQLSELSRKYQALPDSAKTYVTQREHAMLTPAERKHVAKDRILPDTKK